MKKIAICIIMVLSIQILLGQNRTTTTEDYILQYRNIAIANEKQYGIPSSITLAQGILESGSGRSSLATEGNNHFGIKCHSTWEGKRMYKDDDKKNDCFRVYDNPEDSYTDHSLFLAKGQRYQSLFALDKTDYKSWAKGLKEAGYATNPQYPELLISIIEVYELDKVDNDDYYLLSNQPLANNNVSNDNKDNVTKPEAKQDKPKQIKDKSEKKGLIERWFGNTKWYKRRHETPQERKRRLMDEEIQKMIDQQDVQRTDFEIDFE